MAGMLWSSALTLARECSVAVLMAQTRGAYSVAMQNDDEHAL